MDSITKLFTIMLIALVSTTQAYVVLFEHPNYGGAKVTLYSRIGNNHNVPVKLSNKVSSYIVSSGEKWVGFPQSNLKGKPVIGMKNSKANLRWWNDRISSLKRVE